MINKYLYLQTIVLETAFHNIPFRKPALDFYQNLESFHWRWFWSMEMESMPVKVVLTGTPESLL